jgi:hypothetical protein
LSTAIIDDTGAQLLPCDANATELAKHVLGHARRQIDERVLVANEDLTDELRAHAELVGNGADDVLGLSAVGAPNLETVCLHIAIIVRPLLRTVIA